MPYERKNLDPQYGKSWVDGIHEAGVSLCCSMGLILVRVMFDIMDWVKVEQKMYRELTESIQPNLFLVEMD